jgi:stage II sporulation protein D
MNGLYDKDGNMLSLSGMLPSVSFYVQSAKDGTWLIGGGNGHGVGMSQYGADGMAAQGADMETILGFYYQGAELTRLYE